VDKFLSLSWTLFDQYKSQSWYFDFDTPIELEVFLKMLDAAKI